MRPSAYSDFLMPFVYLFAACWVATATTLIAVLYLPRRHDNG